jgi:hypothetical protein
MKSAEIREEGGRGRMVEEVNPTKINFKHICKYHSDSLCTTIIY